MPIRGSLDAAAARAREWHHAEHSAVCDVLEPWAHGTVVRASRYPRYFDFNVVRVEDDPGMDAASLSEFAETALAGLAHRRVDFDLIAVADRLRSEFCSSGWSSTRLLWMRHALPGSSTVARGVEEVPYDAVAPLRRRWHREDWPDTDAARYHEQARELALRRGVRVFACRRDGEAIAFGQLLRIGSAAEITHVYVHPACRGEGHGTAVTRAAVAAARDAEDLWICADDEDRAGVDHDGVPASRVSPSLR
jgi:ribosomal protein S18 acetylase RimI-like enzyme